MFFLSQTGDKETIHPIILRQELDEWTGLIESAESTDVFCLVFLVILQEILDDLTVFPIIHRAGTIDKNTTGPDAGSCAFQNTALQCR